MDEIERRLRAAGCTPDQIEKHLARLAAARKPKPPKDDTTAERVREPVRHSRPPGPRKREKSKSSGTVWERMARRAQRAGIYK